MATLAESLKPTLYNARSVAGQLGFRPVRVYVYSGVWSGGDAGLGTETATATEIVQASGQPPKVRSLNDEQLALGNLAAGSIRIGPITPSFSGGGTLLALFDGSQQDTGDTLKIRTVGPMGTVDYVIKGIDTDKVLRYMITAEPVR